MIEEDIKNLKKEVKDNSDGLLYLANRIEKLEKTLERLSKKGAFN